MNSIKFELQGSIEKIAEALEKEQDVIIKKAKNGIKIQSMKVKTLK